VSIGAAARPRRTVPFGRIIRERPHLGIFSRLRRSHDRRSLVHAARFPARLNEFARFVSNYRERLWRGEQSALWGVEVGG
jgi:hypothetical protein